MPDTTMAEPTMAEPTTAKSDDGYPSSLPTSTLPRA
jgi:hypothetical protein